VLITLTVLICSSVGCLGKGIATKARKSLKQNVYSDCRLLARSYLVVAAGGKERMG
jgi:hypothetical protein